MKRLILPILTTLIIASTTMAMLAPSVFPDPIHWNRSRKLTWNDFRGTPDRYSDMQAMTHSGIDFGYDCGRGKFEVEIRASFDPTQSWRKRNAGERILAHEQLHFDITELHARKMRKTFADIANPCSLGHGRIMKIVNTHFANWQQMQQDYDNQTRHSLIKEKQAEWEEKIAQELTTLAAYAE